MNKLSIDLTAVTEIPQNYDPRVFSISIELKIVKMHCKFIVIGRSMSLA